MAEFIDRAMVRARSFVRHERGAVAVFFALALAPLAFMAGAAMDYSGAALLKTDLEKATDGAALRLCQVPGSPTQQDLEAVAAQMLTGYLGSTPAF